MRANTVVITIFVLVAAGGCVSTVPDLSNADRIDYSVNEGDLAQVMCNEFSSYRDIEAAVGKKIVNDNLYFDAPYIYCEYDFAAKGQTLFVKIFQGESQQSASEFFNSATADRAEERTQLGIGDNAFLFTNRAGILSSYEIFVIRGSIAFSASGNSNFITAENLELLASSAFV